MATGILLMLVGIFFVLRTVAAPSGQPNLVHRVIALGGGS